MADQAETAARLVMYRATDGECRRWGVPTNLNDLTKEAIAYAADQGWVVLKDNRVCLTDAGRKATRQSAKGRKC